MPEVPVRATVPVRTILVTIGLILATVVAVLFVMRVERVLVWMLIALFFTVALYPVVNLVQRRLTWCQRSLATLVVFLAVVLVLGGLIAAFAVPLATEGTELAGQLPGIVNDAKRAAADRSATCSSAPTPCSSCRTTRRGSARSPPASAPRPLASCAASPPASPARSPIFVLSYLVVLEGPKLVEGTLALLPPQRAERIRRVARDCAKTVTGYISGNLLISVICGVLTYVVLRSCGVPFAGLIALFVGDRRPDPAGRRHPRRRRRVHRGVRALGARRHRRRSSSSSSTSSWRTTCCSRSSSPAR